jgi:hypothetical protein
MRVYEINERGIDGKLIKAHVFMRSADWMRERSVYGDNTSNLLQSGSVRKKKCHWSSR